jgi:anti-sigma-K factor RskA
MYAPMNYNDPTLRQLLAGEYALGALHGAARAQFERLMRRDPALRSLVHEWEQDLAPLALETRAVTPPPRVLAAIKRRIESDAAPTESSPGSLWERLGFWRAFSAIGAAAAVVLAVTTTVLLRAPAVPPSYLAILADQAARPALVVTAYNDPKRLNIESLALPKLSADQVLQVWAIEKDSGTVRPLVAFTPGAPLQVAIKDTEWKLVRTAHSLAASIEPATTVASAPSTSLLYSGLCINLKGGYRR